MATGAAAQTGPEGPTPPPPEEYTPRALVVNRLCAQDMRSDRRVAPGMIVRRIRRRAEQRAAIIKLDAHDGAIRVIRSRAERNRNGIGEDRTISRAAEAHRGR